jgi:hypothetical protein
MKTRKKSPSSVEIRSYQVGFGDCFLLSFVYDRDDKRHVLIDFGTTELPARGTPRKAAKRSDHMPMVARDIESVCGGRLTAVVATHRHADHISGFGTDGATGGSGEIIRGMKPKVVLQPWTEDPAAATGARSATASSGRSARSFIAGLAAMQDVARHAVEYARTAGPRLSPALRRELAFIGEDNLANLSAVKNLMAMGRADGARAVFARYGGKSGLEALLPGVEVHVLGPPDLTQTGKISKMAKRDPDEFWHLLKEPLAAGKGGGPRLAGKSRVPPESRWFRDRLDRLRGSQLLEIVRTLDDQMNNTSLILLFVVGGRKLLFPGDAQLENWCYALEDAPEAGKNRELLADVDVYKVGHHGSLNATPKTLLWEGFTRRKRAAGRLKALLSTLPGKHGKSRNQTEVPRRTLLAALKSDTELFDTQKLKFGATPQMCHVIPIPCKKT